MENKNFRKLALMGLAGGLLCAGEAKAADQVNDLLGNVALNGTYGTLLAGGCGGSGGAGGQCGHAAPQGRTVSSGCAGKQIGFDNAQGYNSQQAANQGYNNMPRQQAMQQDSTYNNSYPSGQQGSNYSTQQGQALSQGCQSMSDPQAGSRDFDSSGMQQQQYSAGCGASKPSQNRNNNHYYADGMMDSQNQMQMDNRMSPSRGMNDNDMYMDSNSRQLAENEARSNPKLGDPRMMMMTDQDLMKQLNNPQTKAMYQGLTPEGKALALKLVNEDPAHDKDLAVKRATERMTEKRNGVMNKSMSH